MFFGQPIVKFEFCNAVFVDAIRIGLSETQVLVANSVEFMNSRDPDSKPRRVVNILK